MNSGLYDIYYKKIAELITTGKIEYFEELKKKTTRDVEEFYNLEGIG